MKCKVVIIGHGYTSRLAVIRSVAQIGCEVTVVVMVGNRKFRKKLNTCKPVDCYSKYVNRYLFCRSKDEEGLIQLLLIECVDPQQKVIIIPDSDFSAAVVDKNQNRLKDHFLFPHIHYTQDAVVEWMDKVRQKELALEVGLNVASSCVIDVKDQQYEIPTDITYPCFTKPLVTIIGGKRLMKRCDNETELRKILDTIVNLGNMQVLVEDFKIIDTEYAVVGFSDGHEVVIPGILQIIDMSHGGHYGVACKGKVMPTTGFEELIKMFKELLIRIGYFGLFDIDFYQSDGKMYFGELNLRFGGSGYAVTKMGVNLPGMMIRSLCGESINDMQKEVLGTATYVNERMLLDDWVSGYISTKKYSQMLSSADIRFVYDKDDPMPCGVYDDYRRSVSIKLKRFIKRFLSIRS